MGHYVVISRSALGSTVNELEWQHFKAGVVGFLDCSLRPQEGECGGGNRR